MRDLYEKLTMEVAELSDSEGDCSRTDVDVVGVGRISLNGVV